MEEIKFTSYTLSKDVGYNQFIPIRRNDFETSFDKKTLIYEVEKTTYNFEIEIIENKYLWMYATYGNPEPCPPNLYNKSTKKNKKNQRTKEDVELRQQFFSMYDFEKGILFLNQSNKKGILEKIFLECFNKKILIKMIFLDIEEFGNKIKEVQSVKFQTLHNIFTQNLKLSEAFKDIFGDEFDFEISVKYKQPQKIFKTLLKRLNDGSKNYEFENLYITGLDDKNFEQIFNAGNFAKKFSIMVNMSEYGLKEEVEVKQKLLEKMQDVQN
ncbi:MAG: hypothetical protein IJB79_08710 [Candidatus Gastranaerophilales bacterium]|nr:hypothetical protein [Candidatus Gastranaerophilales bacterium]